VSISEAIEITINILSSIRISLADGNRNSRHEGMFRLWGRHREANIQAFLMVDVSRRHQNTENGNTVEIVPFFRLYATHTTGQDKDKQGIGLQRVSSYAKHDGPTRVEIAPRQLETDGWYLGGVTNTLIASEDHLNMNEAAIVAWADPLVHSLIDDVNSGLLKTLPQ
jgi:hypothetical protein